MITSFLTSRGFPVVFWVLSLSLVHLIMPIAIRNNVFIGLLLLLLVSFGVEPRGCAWTFPPVVALLLGFLGAAWILTSGVVCPVVGVLTVLSDNAKMLCASSSSCTCVLHGGLL